ncbi:DoxX family protein [Halobacillus sp. B23F22_1]|uniref:DoxX family protein n=1 Tax=Halobacillus sp. B23F22_1 TaxID=3459514 RepID=UPI00373F543F
MIIFKTMSLYIFAIGLFLAGVTHFVYDEGFAVMIPDFVPYKLELVYVTGIMEWMLSLFLIFPQTRRAAGIATAVFLVAVLPANIYAAIIGAPAPWAEDTNLIMLWLRPLFQPLLIWWVLAASK